MHSTRYRPHIDGLRGLAVLAVVSYHFFPRLLPGGFGGVDVFFVISGYVVTNSALARSDASLYRFFIDFMARRIRRIAPALLVCLLVTSLASSLWIPKAWLSESIPHAGRAAFFGLSNIVLYRHVSDYFSHLAAFNPFTHTWSLAVEEQFYVVTPFFLWLWTRGVTLRRAATGLLAIAALCSYSYAVWLNTHSDSGSYYLLATRFWELAVGVMLCFLLRWHEAGRRSLGRNGDMIRSIMGVVAFVTLLAAWLLEHPDGFPGRGAWLIIFSTALVIACLDSGASTTRLGTALSSTPIRALGKGSYSLYLWHWPVIVLFRWTVGLEDAWTLTLAIAISAVLAYLSLVHVERRAATLTAAVGSGRIVVTGILMLALGATIAQTLHAQQHRLSPSKVAQHRDDWYPTRGQSLHSPSGCRVSPIRDDLSHGWRNTFERTGCLGEPSAPRIFVVGDSHALSYGPLFARYALETGSPVTVYNNGGCPMLSLQPEREAGTDCRASASSALADMLPRLREGDIVFLPSLRLPRYVDQGATSPNAMVESMVSGTEANAARQAAMAPARETLRQLRRTGAKVVIQAPNLILKAPPFRCVDWWTVPNPVCAGGTSIPRAQFEALRAPVMMSLTSLAATDEGVALFDPLPSLCASNSLCRGFHNGRPLFFDGDHLSAYGNQVVYPAFLDAMRATARAIETPPRRAPAR